MLIYPISDIKKRTKNNEHELWDIIRMQWIKLTPEELVRQAFIHYLIKTKKYPKESILIEKEISVYNTSKRFDVAVVKSPTDFFLLAECKAPYVELNEQVIKQTLTYNLTLNAPVLVLTNGIHEYVFEYINHQWLSVTTIPNY